MSLGVDKQLPPRLSVGNRAAPYTPSNSVTNHVLHDIHQDVQSPPDATPTLADAQTAHGRHQTGHAEVYVAGAGPGDQYKVGQTSTDIDFQPIRDMCSKDIRDADIDLSPNAFAEHRRATWPAFHCTGCETNIAKLGPIYDAVRSSRVPNCMGVRAPLPSGLNISAWEKYIDLKSDEAELLDMVKYGFPMGYMGPISDSCTTPNHSSALNYPDHIHDFISEEVRTWGGRGPFLGSPLYTLGPYLPTHDKGET